jgi:hypothetical protein
MKKLCTLSRADVNNIVISPRVGNSASVCFVVGADSDGDWTTAYNGSCESSLIYAFRDLREANPDAVIVWSGWEGWTERQFLNHPAAVLCLRTETFYREVSTSDGDTRFVRELIIV